MNFKHRPFIGALIIMSSVGLGLAMAAPPAGKQKVCHKAGNKFVELEVADEAADKGHMKHGDHVPQAYWADEDKDGFGAGASVESCTPPAGYVPQGGDCQPGNAAIHPGAKEVCGDKIDNNCDGRVDEGCVPTTPPMSHEVEVLLHCASDSLVLAKYGVGTHTLPWEVQRNISFVRFVGGSQGAVTLHHCDGRTMDVTTNLNLCSLQGGCCSPDRWNDSVCKITVR